MTADVPPSTTAAPTARDGVLPIDGDPGTCLRWSRRADTTEVELIGDDLDRVDADRVTTATRAVGIVSRFPSLGDSRVQLAAEHPPERDRAFPTEVAIALGFAPRRELLQLRRPLPVPADHAARRTAPRLPVRAFRPGADDAAWLRANNRAFAAHPDQGAETPATLATRSAQPWFDRAGFLVVDDPERDGELAGFCWTKVHPPTDVDPALGEIYVVGVDPSHQGEGLGVALVLHGLDHLAERGVPVANLYVEADNGPALRLYDRLGFTVHARRRVYAR